MSFVTVLESLENLIFPAANSMGFMFAIVLLPRLWFFLAEAWVYKQDVQTHWIRSYLLVVACVMFLSLPAIALQFAS
jgi:hypothetical protein